MTTTLEYGQRPGGLNVRLDRGKWSSSVTYVVTEKAGQQLTPEIIYSTSTNSTTFIQVIGSVEDGVSGGSQALVSLGAFLAGRLRQVSHDLRQVDDGGFVYEVQINFESSVADTITAAIDTKNEGQPGFVAIEYSAQGEAVDVYRVYVTAPSNKDTPSDVDIGGTKVDEGGQPITLFNNVSRITIRNVVAGRPPLTAMAHLNQRNSETFTIGTYDFPPSTLLFTGVNITRTGSSTYEIVYTIIYENGFHLRQIATKSRETDKPICGTIDDACSTAAPSAVTAITTSHARCVYFRQPFPTSFPFSDLNITQ